MAEAPITVEVWSDLVCPWCYIGKRRLERAVEMVDQPVAVRYRSFELNPRRRYQPDKSLAELLAEKYRVSLPQAEAMNRRVTEAAADEGIEFRLDLARPANTFDAHRLTHLASRSGRQEAVVERLHAAYFCEGRNLEERSTLVELSVEASLDRGRVAEALESEAFADEVRGDEARAGELDIHGVPFFVLEGRYGISGAQEPVWLARALQRVGEERRATAGSNSDGVPERAEGS
jgi:predicted DsbA family dithiol-disulfide isomerase